MSEIELKLMLLRYNMLSKEKAVAIYMYEHTGKSSYYDDRWEECIDEMMKMESLYFPTSIKPQII